MLPQAIFVPLSGSHLGVTNGDQNEAGAAASARGGGRRGSVGPESYGATTKPLRLGIDGFDLGVPVPAYVFTHNKGVIPALATQWQLGAATLAIDVDDGIEGGTSGGPVVTRDGRLLGIVSSSGGE